MIDSTYINMLTGLTIGTALTIGLVVIAWVALHLIRLSIIVAQDIMHRLKYRKPKPLMGSMQHPFIIHGDELDYPDPAPAPPPEPAPEPKPVAKARKPRVVK